jgi:hypothetical protein
MSIKKQQEIIHSINNNTKTRLKPSTVCDGVGVFALINIKEGENIFPDIISDSNLIEWEYIDNNVVKKYLNSLCNTDNKGIYLSRLPNEINISYYVNHSDNPNVFHNLDLDQYFALKEIYAGEEILCCYTEQEKKDF